METVKKMFKMAIVLFFCLGMFMTSGQAREISNVNLVTGPFGTGSYTIGMALEEIAKKNHPWLRVASTESPGVVYNIKKMEVDPQFKKNSMISNGSYMMWFAKQGLKPLNKKMGFDQKTIAVYSSGIVWFATTDTDIKSIADLAGKRVALGKKAQLGCGIVANWYLDIGWGLEGKVKKQWIGNKPALRALKDGLVDAICISGYINPATQQFIPSPHTQELLASKKIYHLSIGKNAVNKVADAYPGSPKSILTLPPGTIKGQDKPVVANSGNVYWTVSDQFPEEHAYEIVKLLIKHVDTFKDYHALGKLMSPESLCYGLNPEGMHPGALKAYKEAGLIK